MSTSPNQLDTIYRQVREYFDSHPVISIRPINGDPPDQYEITYMITGMCTSGEGKISETIDHKVELAIPFGFPHFPPSCKPKSDIFHPDFDPAAICLGDFWEQDRSLADLIIHLGQMINGEIYSTSNAFNEDAATWYQDHADKFPLSHIKWQPDHSSQPSSQNDVHEIDTLDDADLEAGFDFLALETTGEDEDIILNTSFQEPDSTAEIDIDHLNRLASQKKYFTLLKNCPDSTQASAELNQLCQKARDEISRVEKLHRDGKKFENRGEAQVALEKYQQIATLVTDFPTLDSDIHRIKQTLTLLADISPDITPDFLESDPSSAADSSPSLEEPTSKGTPKKSKKVKTEKVQTPHDLFLPPKRSKSKIPLFLFFGILAAGIGYGGYFWYSFTEKLSDAEEAYSECSTLYANNRFEAAQNSCNQALELVRDVKFIHQDFAQQLEKFILEILQSEKLTQGLAGNIFIDGRYIPKDQAEALQSIKQKFNEAETLFNAEKWQPALQLYEALLDDANINNFFDRSRIEDLKRQRLLAEFRMFYDPAQIAMQNGQWEDAIEKLLQAQKILVSLAESDRSQYSEKLQYALQKSQFANLKQQGDLSFTGSDWLSAIATYNLALASGQKTALPPESIDAIRNNIKRAELYTTINKGNKAFAAGSWDDAIAAYSEARDVLVSIQNSPSQTHSDINILKLDRIILQASIIRDRQTIQSLVENNNQAQARMVYQKIIAAIDNSTFAAEEEFQKTKAEINTAIQSLDKKVILMAKEEYLKTNYQSLFTANYPSVNPEHLSNPVIASTKETDSKLVFKMSCTENDGGRPLTLVMFYAFNKNTGKWSLYSEN